MKEFNTIKTLLKIVWLASEMIGENRKGGYYCQMHPDGQITFLRMIGWVPPEKEAKYHRLCKEKADRLLASPATLSSFETRDPDKEQFPGAVRSADGIIDSFSGLPNDWDEACMLVLDAARNGDHEPSEHFMEVVERTGNFHAETLFYACRTFAF